MRFALLTTLVASAVFATTQAGADDTVTVHVDSPARLELQRQEPDGAWVTECVGVCDLPLPIGRYRVRDGTTPIAHSFMLDEAGRRSTVTVEAVRKKDPATGGVFLAVGGSIAFGGFALIVIGGFVAAFDSAFNSFGSTSSNNNSATVWLVSGSAALAGGAALLAVGLALVVGRVEPRVTVSATGLRVVF